MPRDSRGRGERSEARLANCAKTRPPEGRPLIEAELEASVRSAQAPASLGLHRFFRVRDRDVVETRLMPAAILRDERALLWRFRMIKLRYLLVVSLFAFGLAACGDGSGETLADELGVASECEQFSDCPVVLLEGEVMQLSCLREYKGGYCGIADCGADRECPEGSICVAHTDGENYCFRACDHKSECNANRSPESEANCSANFEWAEPSEDDGRKACIPSSSGS